MERQFAYVNGKKREVIMIRGNECVREGYNCRASIADKFERKCDLLGEDKSKIVERLVEAFTNVTGWGREVKQSPLFETRIGPHVHEAVERTSEGMFPWRPNTN